MSADITEAEALKKKIADIFTLNDAMYGKLHSKREKQQDLKHRIALLVKAELVALEAKLAEREEGNRLLNSQLTVAASLLLHPTIYPMLSDAEKSMLKDLSTTAKAYTEREIAEGARQERERLQPALELAAVAYEFDTLSRGRFNGGNVPNGKIPPLRKRLTELVMALPVDVVQTLQPAEQAEEATHDLP